MTNLSEWIKSVPVPFERLSLDQLRAFKHSFEHLTAMDLGPEVPLAVRNAHHGFRFLVAFGIMLIHEKKFPPLNRCWEDLTSRYHKEPILDDGVFLESWIFIDFPINKAGRTVLDEFADHWTTTQDGLQQFGPFIEAAKKSRYGLHKEILSTSKITKFRELFTDQVFSTIRSVPDYHPGEIFLCRLFEFGGHCFLMGDPKNFPATHEDWLEDRVVARLLEQERKGTVAEQYECFMKLAGPYWMSVVCEGRDGKILEPDHWKSYH